LSGIAVRITAVVDEACHVPIACGVDDVIVVHPEQVATADTCRLVATFPLVRHSLTHNLSDILYDHLISCYGFDGKEAPVVDGGFGKLEQLLPCLQLNL
jgi:hypothetical protein